MEGWFGLNGHMCFYTSIEIINVEENLCRLASYITSPIYKYQRTRILLLYELHINNQPFGLHKILIYH